MAKHVCRARAISHDFGESRQKKTPYIAIIFETVPADANDSPERYEWNGWLNEKCWDSTMEQLELCGATFPDGDLRKVTGYTKNVVSVTIEDTEWGPRVARINRPGTVSDENRLSGSKLEEISRAMRGRLLNGGNGGARPAAPKVSDPFASMSTPQHHDDAHLDGRDPSGQHPEIETEGGGARGDDDIPF